MTAINVLRLSDCIHLVTDGLGAPNPETPEAGGRRRAISKVTVHPHLPAAIATRGETPALLTLPALLPSLGQSYDEVKANFVDRLRPDWEAAQRRWKRGGGRDIAEFFVAGFTEAGTPDAFACITHDRYEDLRPWIIIDLAAGLTMAPLELRLFERLSAEASADGFSIDQFAVNAIEGQRALAISDGPSGKQLKGADQIGKFVQLTTVTRDQIVTRVVHRFTD